MASQQAAAPPPPTVVVTTIGRRTVPVVDDFTARTFGTTSIDIKARVEGVLEQVRFQPGSLVNAGDVLFVIQPAAYQAAVLSAQAAVLKAQADLKHAQDQLSVAQAKSGVNSAQADLALANVNLARARPLVAKQAIPQQDLDNAIAQQRISQAKYNTAVSQLQDAALTSKTNLMQAQAGVEAANAQLVQANLNLSYTTIRAPVTGLAGLLKVDQGNLVGRGDATTLVTLIAVDPIRVDFQLTETDYLYLMTNGYKTGSSDLQLVLADNSLYPHIGHPSALANALDPQTGTITIQSLFPNPEGILRPGQFARVRVTVQQQRNAVLVPQRAIVEVQGSKTVRVVGKGNKVDVRSVRLGPAFKDYFTVTSGLRAGDRVIVEGVQKADPGTVVRPVER